MGENTAGETLAQKLDKINNIFAKEKQSIVTPKKPDIGRPSRDRETEEVEHSRIHF